MRCLPRDHSLHRLPIISAGQLHSVGRSDAEEKNTIATAYAPARGAFGYKDTKKVRKTQENITEIIDFQCII